MASLWEELQEGFGSILTDLGTPVVYSQDDSVPQDISIILQDRCGSLSDGTYLGKYWEATINRKDVPDPCPGDTFFCTETMDEFTVREILEMDNVATTVVAEKTG